MQLSEETKAIALQVSATYNNKPVFVNDKGEIFTEKQFALASVGHDSERFVEVNPNEGIKPSAPTAEEEEANRQAAEAALLKSKEVQAIVSELMKAREANAELEKVKNAEIERLKIEIEDRIKEYSGLRDNFNLSIEKNIELENEITFLKEGKISAPTLTEEDKEALAAIAANLKAEEAAATATQKETKPKTAR